MSDPTARPTPAAVPGPSGPGESAVSPAGRDALEWRLREATGLLAVAPGISSATDLAQGLRLIFSRRRRLLPRLVGATAALRAGGAGASRRHRGAGGRAPQPCAAS